MLSSSARTSPNLGYNYHGVKMLPIPIDLVPEFELLSREFAGGFELPNKEWSIGCDLVVYRDGKDSIGWHADDTQSESCVLAVVVESDGERPVCIRPNKKVHLLVEGDEEIELYVKEGDGYELDAGCQLGYEHSLPKKKEVKARRMVAIFRQGAVKNVDKDTGNPCCVKEYMRLGLLKGEEAEGGGGGEKEVGVDPTKQERIPPTIEAPLNFGRPNPKSTSISEGSICSRNEIYQAQLHNSDQRGISGNIEMGADAVVLARNDGRVRERDGFTWLRYTSARKQGGGGMATSFNIKNPIRVFRSSAVQSPFAPINSTQKKYSSHYTSIYRYDGLYTIVKMINNGGDDTRDLPEPEDDEVMPQNTFFMERNPTEMEVEEWRIREGHPTETPFRLGAAVIPKEYYNLKTAEELWVDVQATRNVGLDDRSPIPYVDPKIDMEITRFKSDEGQPMKRVRNPMVAALTDIVDTIEYRASLGLTARKEEEKRIEVGSVEWMKKKKALWRGQLVESRVSKEKTHVVHANVAHTLEMMVRKVAIKEEDSLFNEEPSPFDLSRNLDMEEEFNPWLGKRKMEWRKRYRKALTFEKSWGNPLTTPIYAPREDMVYTSRPTFQTLEQQNMATTKINRMYTAGLLSKTGGRDNRRRAVVSITVNNKVQPGVRLMTTKAIEMSRNFERKLRKHGADQAKVMEHVNNKDQPTRSVCEVVQVKQGGLRVVKHWLKNGTEKLATIDINDVSLGWWHHNFDVQEAIDEGKRSQNPKVRDIISVKGLQIPVKITPEGYGTAYKCKVIEQVAGLGVEVVEGKDNVGGLYLFNKYEDVWCFVDGERCKGGGRSKG
ncbi:hypothetical protein TL16_g01483 [Triparma laevis f. inornata]|uniref:YDG domain-containing protein n=1 Tax=Triparma laevis f. inornata TaxID=1714386 RepID=A0A9W6ZIY6_9STRA|nr:hypothetical protein TL16_g01483 [Triparma laevis f. inornata]